jgi:hypothetical protein
MTSCPLDCFKIIPRRFKLIIVCSYYIRQIDDKYYINAFNSKIEILKYNKALK